MGIGASIKKDVITLLNGLQDIGDNGLNQNKVKLRVFIKG